MSVTFGAIARTLLVPGVTGVAAAWFFTATLHRDGSVPSAKDRPTVSASPRTVADLSPQRPPPAWRVPASMSGDAPEGSDAGTSTSTPEPAEIDPVSWHAHHVANHARLIADHEQEPLDRPWASQAETSFWADIEPVASANAFQVVDTDCRTTSCTARIRWPSRTQARDTYATLLSASYRLNCAKEILLPDADDDSQPFEAVIVFDCTEHRAGAI